MKKPRTFRIRTNVWGNTYAYYGNRKILMFIEHSLNPTPEEWAASVRAKGHTVKFV